MAANASRKAVENETSLRIMVKWPNDLVVATGKIGGILIEAKTIGEQVMFVVIGIGLNINLASRQLPSGATSVFVETGKRCDNRRLLHSIIDQMSSDYSTLRRPSIIVSEWWRHCVHRPSMVEIVNQDGTLKGISRGLEEDGSLIVETGDHQVARVAGGTLRIVD